MRRVANYFFLILFFPAFLGCVEKRDLSQNVLVAHISSSPDGLHPFNNNSAIRTYIFNYTQRTLVMMDLEQLKAVPALITLMPEASSDGLEYTYELLEGVKWDDGTPLTVEDIIFTTKIQIAPLTNNAAVKGIYKSVIEKVEKHPSDNNKFIVTCKQVHVSNKDIYSEIYIQQKAKWDPENILGNYTFSNIHDESFDPSKKVKEWFNAFNSGDNSYRPSNLVGLGPYKVTEFVPSGYITLEKKKNWWGETWPSIYERSYPEKIIFRIINDPSASYLALKNEDIDVSTYVGTNRLLKLQKLDYFNKNYHSKFLNQYAYGYMGLNMKPDGIKQRSFFTDKRVRRAMAHLVPVDEIIKVIVKGKASRQVANISPLKKAYNSELTPIPFDIEKAKGILDEAGWKDTDGDNIRDKVVNGKRIPFSYKLSYMASPASKEQALMIKEAMYKAGVNVEPLPMDFTLFYKNAYEHNFEAMMGAWGGSAAYSDPIQLWHTSSWVNKGSNFTGFGDAQSDSLIHLANTSLDETKHLDALKQLQKKIYEDQPYVFLYSYTRKVAIHKRFDNANMYVEKPGVILGNLKLRAMFDINTNKKPL